MEADRENVFKNHKALKKASCPSDLNSVGLSFSRSQHFVNVVSCRK